jgi:TolB-like protein
MNFFNELKRRNVFRVGIAYAVVAWLVMQFADVVLNNITAPGWVFQAIMLLLAIGFPIVLVFAWAFEMTPEGLKKEKNVDRSHSIAPRTGRKLDRAIIVFLVVALGYFVYDKFSHEPLEDTGEIAPSIPAALPANDNAMQDTAPARGEDEKSVAVLPFAFRSTNQEDQFFAEGMHDDLLTQLAKIGSLKVISRTSVLEYKDTIKKIPEIAAELGVATIVEGGVQRSGSRIRFNAQLIDARTDEHLWAETYNRELTAENLFDIQAEIARAIALALQATLSPEEEASIDRRLTNNLEAWEAYQRAGRLRQMQTAEGLRGALIEVNLALDKDPKFAAAWGLRAVTLLAQHWFYDTNLENRDLAWEAIQRGRSIDPTLPELDRAEGFYHYWGFRDYKKALTFMQKASAALPNDSRAHLARGYVFRRLGDWDKALDAFELAAELDPRNITPIGDIVGTLTWLHRFDQAERAFVSVPNADRNSPTILWQLADFQLQSRGNVNAHHELNHLVSAVHSVAQANTWYSSLYIHDFDAAMQDVAEWQDRFLVTKDHNVTRKLLTGLTLHFAGDTETARPLLLESLQQYEGLLLENENDFPILRSLCFISGGLGDRQAATDYCNASLEAAPTDAFRMGVYQFDAAAGLAMAGETQAVLVILKIILESGIGPTIYPIMYHPAFDGIRSEPVFIEVMQQYAPEEQRL